MTSPRTAPHHAAPIDGQAAAGGALGELIRRRCGLIVRGSQMPLLAELVEARAAAHGLTDPLGYYDLLDAEPDGSAEWMTVIDGLVSHETAFFRHPASFEALRARLLPELRGRRDVGGNALSIWSAGCSNGAEAYSLAMVAALAAPRAFTVWGADISRAAIELARRGRYSARAVQSVPADLRERFVRPAPGTLAGEFEVVASLRQRVRFVAADLYTACGMGLTHDVIFCQNVLIYFARAAVDQLVALLAARLTHGGFLLLGPGEGPSRCPQGLEPLNIAGVRVYRRVGRIVTEVRP